MLTPACKDGQLKMNHSSLKLEETTSLSMTQLVVFLVLKLLKVGFVLDINVLIRNKL